MARFLRDFANVFMAALLAKRVTEDMVRQAPYPALGATTVVAVLVGSALGRRRRSTKAA